MSEEEKKAIELLSKKDTEYYYRYVDVREAVYIILNLIENQQKELNNLKEIEKSHQEENGKLRVELEQEKEKNKELEAENFSLNEMKKYNKKHYISKEKIREKIKELKEEIKLARKEKDLVIVAELELQVDILKQILEEK